MDRHPPPEDLLRFLEPYDRTVRNLAFELRAVVLDEIAPAVETIYDAYNAVALGYGPSDRLKHGICHIAVYTKHVNLGFNHGASMGDPAGLLEGTGKAVRHIPMRTPADVARPEIREYLARAWKLAGSPPRAGKLKSVVKGEYPTKRRPGRGSKKA